MTVSEIFESYLARAVLPAGSYAFRSAAAIRSIARTPNGRPVFEALLEAEAKLSPSNAAAFYALLEMFERGESFVDAGGKSLDTAFKKQTIQHDEYVPLSAAAAAGYTLCIRHNDDESSILTFKFPPDDHFSAWPIVRFKMEQRVPQTSVDRVLRVASLEKPSVPAVVLAETGIEATLLGPARFTITTHRKVFKIFAGGASDPPMNITFDKIEGRDRHMDRACEIYEVEVEAAGEVDFGRGLPLVRTLADSLSANHRLYPTRDNKVTRVIRTLAFYDSAVGT